MTTKQIRFTATDAILDALEELKLKFKFLNDTEIFKMAFSKFYRDEMGYDENGFSPQFQKELDEAIADADAGENLEGPFNSMEEFISIPWDEYP